MSRQYHHVFISSLKISVTSPQVQDVAEGAVDYNIPIIRINRKSVASINGGLQNPSPLVFSPRWDAVGEQFNRESRRFDYPPPSGIQRPKSDEDIAFMSVSGFIWILPE